jgi:hypothetical protein
MPRCKLSEGSDEALFRVIQAPRMDYGQLIRRGTSALIAQATAKVRFGSLLRIQLGVPAGRCLLCHTWPCGRNQKSLLVLVVGINLQRNGLKIEISPAG